MKMTSPILRKCSRFRHPSFSLHFLGVDNLSYVTLRTEYVLPFIKNGDLQQMVEKVHDAHLKLHHKTGEGHEFLGWLDLPYNYDREEFERIKAIDGAKVVKEPYEMQGSWIATLSDPDGNYFQLMTPWEG